MTNPNQLCDVLLFVCSNMADETNLSSKLPVAARTREVFKGGFEGVLVSLLLTTMGAFFYLKFSMEDFLWQMFNRHSGNMACPS